MMTLRRNTFCFLIWAGLSSLLAVAMTPDGFKTLNIGEQAPHFSLPGVDGKTYTLDSFSDSDILMIYFTGTHCPTSHGVEDRFQKLLSELKEKPFAIVAINPNHPDGLRLDEYGYSEYEETLEDSKRYAEDHGWDFPFLYDGDQQLTARAYGCLATPHVFIFDQNRKLRYKGRFDDSRFEDPETVTQSDARNAILALLENREVPVKETRPFGCSTKWKERNKHVMEMKSKQNAIPARLDTIDAKGIADLRKNGSGNLRLINVWSTTCAPCVKEFPELVNIQNRFGLRPFELITISLDNPKDQKRVLQFLNQKQASHPKRIQESLQKQGRTSNHYLYTENSIDLLASTLDPQWEGPTPHTILVDNNGDILYRKTGEISSETIKKEILGYLGDSYLK